MEAIDECEPLLLDENEVKYKKKTSSARYGVQKSNFSTWLRHSNWYLGSILLVLLLNISLIVWVSIAQHTPQSGWFLAMEYLVLVAVVFETVVEIRFQGISAYFCGTLLLTSTDDSECSSNADSDESQIIACCYLCGNYLQLGLVLLCLVAVVLTASHVGSEEEEISLWFLLIRYASYLVVLVYGQVRGIRTKGGVRNTLTSLCCPHRSQKGWDVHF